MDYKKNIIESKFLRGFISEYYEYKMYSYDDKDRLLYALCNSDKDKLKIIKRKIKQIKLKISKLGYEQLSFAYLMSFQNGDIDFGKSISFWMDKFIESYLDNYNEISFHPIQEQLIVFLKKDELDGECFEQDNEFWDYYPKSLHPKLTEVIEILPKEAELIDEIEFVIEEHKKINFWEIDFENFEKFINISKPLEELFNLCNLFVQINRLKYYNESLIYIQAQQTETKIEQETPTFKNNFDNSKPMEIYNHFKAGLVEKGYLTEQELVEYLKAAFELKTIPKTLFKIKNTPKKQKISKVFYEFYKNIAGTPHGKQKSYAALLGNYFEGYDTDNISTNFSK